MNKSSASDPLRSLRRASLLLRLLSMRPAAGWRLTDLAQASGLHHATVHRLVRGMCEERLAMRVPDSVRYTLGPLAHELGLAAAPQFHPPPQVQERLERLAQQSRDIVFLTMRSGDDSVCIGRWEGRRALKAYTVHVGTRRALCLSAGGVAVLAALPAPVRDAILRRNLEDIAVRGEARVAAVRRMVTRSVRLGYGLNEEGLIPGIVAVGVAFGPSPRMPIGAISLGAGAADFGPDRRDSMVERLRREAAFVSEAWQHGRYWDPGAGGRSDA